MVSFCPSYFLEDFKTSRVLPILINNGLTPRNSIKIKELATWYFGLVLLEVLPILFAVFPLELSVQELPILRHNKKVLS